MPVKGLSRLVAGIWFVNLAALALLVGFAFWHFPRQPGAPVVLTGFRASVTASASQTPTKEHTPIASPTKAATITPWASPTPGPSLTPITPPAYLIGAIHPSPEKWREWPIVSGFSHQALNILFDAKQKQALNIRAFSKVGDCQMTSDNFLGGFATGAYEIPPNLEETVAWFSGSMKSESITAHRGLAISAALNPMFGYAAGYTQCHKDETPLACELRTNRPVVVLIGMGTNWSRGAEASFAKYLRQEIELVLASGALPILSTKADNVEQDWALNGVIAAVAYEYNLPLVNVWRAVQNQPNRGLDKRDYIHLNRYGIRQRNEAWLIMLGQVYLVVGDGKGE